MTDITLTFTPDGTGHGLYTDAIDLRKMGRLSVRRASTIEFDPARQEWEVRDQGGHLRFHHPSRQICLAWEHQRYNERHYDELQDGTRAVAARLRGGRPPCAQPR